MNDERQPQRTRRISAVDGKKNKKNFVIFAIFVIFVIAECRLRIYNIDGLQFTIYGKEYNMKIDEYLNEQGIAFKSHKHPPAYTAQEVAAEEHVSGNMLAKTVIVHDGEGYTMCVLPASYKLDMKKVAEIRKADKVRLADETELSKIFADTEVGAEPPFGNLYDIPTLVDEHLTSQDDIIFQAGTHRQAIKMKYADYASLVKPTVTDLAIQM